MYIYIYIAYKGIISANLTHVTYQSCYTFDDTKTGSIFIFFYKI